MYMYYYNCTMSRYQKIMDHKVFKRTRFNKSVKKSFNKKLKTRAPPTGVFRTKEIFLKGA